MQSSRRWRLFWWTLPAVIVFLVVGGLLLLLWIWNMQAGSQYREGEYELAEASYRRQGAVSEVFPEPWKAVYNEGTVQLADQRYEESNEVLAVALEEVPEAPVDESGLKDPQSPECMVRTNLSLTFEGMADAKRGAGELEEAIGLYQQALEALGACTSDGESEAEQQERPEPTDGWRPDVDEQRQWDKMQESEQEQEEESSGGNGSPSEPEPSTSEAPADPRVQELESRNQSASPTAGPEGEGFGGGQNW
nr:tetratricopeptide repeat protein [Actinomycetales bacterium]